MTPEQLDTVLRSRLAELPGAPTFDASAREAAFASFAATGFPSRKHERWRYTDLAPIANGRFKMLEQPQPDAAASPEALLAQAGLADGRAAVVFVDGALAYQSTDDWLEAGSLELMGVAQSLQTFGSPLGGCDLTVWPLAALNVAFARDGLHVAARSGAQPAEPLHVLFASTAREPRATHPQLTVRLEAQATLTLIVHHLSEPASENWTNVLVSAELAAGARLDLHRVQSCGPEHLQTELLHAKLGPEAHLELTSVDLGSRLVRNDVVVRLDETGASCELAGLATPVDAQHVDNHVSVEHRASDTTSNQIFRIIAAEHGRGVFNGRVAVGKGTRGISASQSSDNLLLDASAEIDTKPELEINADDVRCSHGATVGEIDESQLFYLRARGIGESDARGLLTLAFADRILDRVPGASLKRSIAEKFGVTLPMETDPKMSQARPLPTGVSTATRAIESLRTDFPALDQLVRGKPLVYLDSAASAQRPQRVIDAMVTQESRNHANIHRGVHELSQRSTDAFERARELVREFLNAASTQEIVFTRGTTESINLVASSLGRMLLEPGDEVLVTQMEHHSNIVPWQLICEQTGARLVAAPITRTGEVDLEAFDRCLNERTKIVAVVHVSNALGTINPVKALIDKAHGAGALTVVDGAQAAPHLVIDVRELGCDFYALSGHKMYGPTGIGVLYGKERWLDRMPPYQGGGEMILTVSFESSTYAALPHKFEAGTPNITGAIGLGATIEYLAAIDTQARIDYEDALLRYATEQLAQVPGLEIIGTAPAKAGVVSFTLGSIHAHDVGTILDQEAVAIRTGHHCAMPVMDFFCVPATARASFGLYNNRDDVDRLVLGLEHALEIFA